MTDLDSEFFNHPDPNPVKMGPGPQMVIDLRQLYLLPNSLYFELDQMLYLIPEDLFS